MFFGTLFLFIFKLGSYLLAGLNVYACDYQSNRLARQYLLSPVGFAIDKQHFLVMNWPKSHLGVTHGLSFKINKLNSNC